MFFLKVLRMNSLVYLLVNLFLVGLNRGSVVDATVSLTDSSPSENKNLFSPEDEYAHPNDPYMNYLFKPRLTFSGIYRADVQTINNDPTNFDTVNFDPSDGLESDSNFNPRGSAQWNVDATVTQICYSNEVCVSDINENEPLVGAKFQDGGKKTSAKMVDIDPDAKFTSGIWGWRIRIGDSFSADFRPVPLTYLWTKMVGGYSFFHQGAVYQSELSNIHWMKSKESSPFIKEWQEMQEKNGNVSNQKLSIRLNLDMYETNPKKSMFTYGRVTGSIGLLGVKSPPFFTHGRMLRAQSQDFQDAPFIVDKIKNKINIDFGNSFQINKYGSFDTGLHGDLYVALPLDDVKTSPTCDNRFLWLGKVFYLHPTWYNSSAGILSFPSMGSLSEKAKKVIQNNPLVVAEVSGNWPAINCKKIVLAEALDGIDIHPYEDWTLRKSPNEKAQVHLIVTKFGEPLTKKKVQFKPNSCKSLFSKGQGPEIGIPPLPSPSNATTNNSGIATFEISEIKDPGNPRGYIDGQIYAFTFSVEGQKLNFNEMCKKNPFMLYNFVIVILVWNQYSTNNTPTWLDNVFPIFKQYANLYPVMTENFVDLGNYYEVVSHKHAIKMSMELSIEHPNHMPVTRDLSPSKREHIVKWLSEDVPPIGKPKDFYTVENLKKDLQTALQLEQSTIPPYLTALASIKYNYNADVQSIIRSIVIQEMMYMNLVANILNSVGGSPVLHRKDFIPFYPSRLPGGVQPALVVPIEKLSINLIRNVFMMIEQPAVTQEKNLSLNWAIDYLSREKYARQYAPGSQITDPNVDGTYFPCDKKNFQEESETNIMLRHLGSSQKTRKRKLRNENKKQKFQTKYPDEHYEYEEHHNTIGGFYNHILNSLGNLTNCGNNDNIFTGKPERQVIVNWPVHGESINVTDFSSAVEAIKLIIEQGEGSSPCNPLAWNDGKEKDLSHYFLFYSIVEKHHINVVGTQQEKCKTIREDVVDYPELCNGTYYFNGSKIPFDPEGVWPMISNPKMSKYKKNSKVYLMAKQFNKVYTKLLKSLEYVFNGHPDHFKDALGLMASVDLHLKNLVRTPIDPDGDPDVGPNAGPTFEFDP